MGCSGRIINVQGNCYGKQNYLQQLLQHRQRMQQMESNILLLPVAAASSAPHQEIVMWPLRCLDFKMMVMFYITMFMLYK